MTQKYSSTCSGVKIDKTKAGAFLREICARAEATLPAPPLTSVYGIVISSDGSGRKIVIFPMRSARLFLEHTQKT